MKRTYNLIRPVLIGLCLLLTLLTLAACTADMNIGNNTALGEQFMDHVMADDYDAAYEMVKATVSDGDFRAYWAAMRPVVEDAETYEMEQIGWNLNTTNGLTTRTTAYQVYPDNGRTVLLRIVTREDIEGIAGIHFSDVTDFLHHTETFVPTVRIILWVVSALAFAFTVWMFVDCLRRKMKYKVLWAILIFGAVAFTVTVGETLDFNFRFGLMLQTSTVVADPGLLAVVTKVAVPVGAILYLCLRKKFTIDPNAPAEGDIDEAAELTPIANIYTAEEVTAAESSKSAEEGNDSQE